MISPDFMQMLLRLGLDLIVTLIIVHFLYYPKSKRRYFYFTFVMLSMAIFFLVYYMLFALEGMKTKAGIGIGMGLFGLLSIMRYRTESMPVREMTYLFVLIVLSVVNALGEGMAIEELFFANIFFIVLIAVMEMSLKILPSKLIEYDRIDLLKPERRNELMEDLTNRTCLNIVRIEIGAMNLLKDMVMLKVYYRTDNGGSSNSVDHKTKLDKSDLQNV